ncbi:hypothetical protein K440DRAFT_661521 [Wilcoxina mikolae CBS 423.85]|nr:hypothetical protein K440DRAFT_661521 [Wilcoxina mikolae CBS 423.85]
MRASWGNITARFGSYQPIALVCSTFGIILALGAASSLWFWSLNDNPASLRSRIALAGWTASAIAICSAFLRACIAVQLGTCCMMVASLAFEKNCVLLQDAAAMSIYRYAANAPYPMVLPVLRGTRISKHFFGISLLVLLSNLTILSQFISTILLSDTGPDSIAGRLENVSLAYRPNSPCCASPTFPTLAQKPVEFPLFAERAAKYFSISSNSTGPGISDTGPTLRALLPLLPVNRSSLLSYHGKAAMIDSHVLCVSPTPKQIWDDGLSISGNLTAPFLREALASGQLEDRGSFGRNETNISSIFTFNECVHDSRYRVCAVTGDAHYAYRQDPSFPAKYLLPGLGWTMGNSTQPLAPGLDHWWLVMTEEDNYADSSEMKHTFNGTEWTKISGISGAGGAGLAIRMTLCYSTFHIAFATIAIKANKTIKEPIYSIEAKRRDASDRYNTTLIRRHLGATLDDQARGIFNLTDYQMSHEKVNNFRPITAQWRATVRGTPNWRITLNDYGHQIYQSILNAVIADTNRASLALQAIFTLHTASGYYDQLEKFDGYNTSTLQTVRPVIVPVGKRGLFTVAGIIGLHFLSVGLVFWLYFTSNTPKFLDQAWQTVGQLHSGDAGEFLSSARNLGDRDVGRLPLAAAMWDAPVGISKEAKIETTNCRTTSYIPLESSHDTSPTSLRTRWKRILDQKETANHSSSTSLLVQPESIARHTTVEMEDREELLGWREVEDSVREKAKNLLYDSRVRVDFMNSSKLHGDLSIAGHSEVCYHYSRAYCATKLAVNFKVNLLIPGGSLGVDVFNISG